MAFTLDSLVVGVAPRLTGVAGGMFLSIYSGEIYGPHETLLLPEGVSSFGAAETEKKNQS